MHLRKLLLVLVALTLAAAARAELSGPAIVTCAAPAPLEGATCEVTTAGASKLIVGTVLVPGTIYRGGQVAVDASGVIQCVGCNCAAAVPTPTVINCPTGVISPGLINTHDHITFTQNDPHFDASGERYEHRHDWRLGLRQHEQITAAGGATLDEVRWGELRFLLGGATSTVSSGGAAGFLRNLDRGVNQEGLDQSPVHFDTFPLGDSNGTQLSSGCGYPDIQLASGIATEESYAPHIAEGIDAAARNEFFCASSTANGGEDLVQPQTAILHAIGLRADDYALIAARGASIVWSPRSNVALYGDTAVVTAATRFGVTVALGTDWMPTGSMNMLRELRCADEWNADRLDGFFSDEALWLMTTRNAAQVTATEDVIGVLAPGRVADIAIFDGRVHPDHRAVIDADPADVVLVMRAGEPIYGDALIVAAASAAICDAIDVCGVAKSVCAAGEIDKTLAQLTAAVGDIYPAFFCDAPSDEPTCFPSRMTTVNGATSYSGESIAGDADGDGIVDASDDCAAVFNPIRPVDGGAQADVDEDGEGDACDVCPLEADTTVCVPEPAAWSGGVLCFLLLVARRWVGNRQR